MSLQLIDSPKENRILGALLSDEYSRLLNDFEFVNLKLGQVLYESGTRQGHVYFPTSCIISLVVVTENGSTAELAIIGNDGLVGIPMVLGGHTTTHRAVVQSAGFAFRLKSDLANWELDQGGGLLPIALRYTQALMTQMAQSVVCNRHHSISQQLCRWLLLSLDRLPRNQLNMTQELIANMLGVRREAITDAAGKLQAAGLIQYSRGRITVTDRPGIEARACECYDVVKREQDRLFHLEPDIRCRGLVRPTLSTLRERAEIRLQEAGLPAPIGEINTISLLHELQIHQIEVELQLEELQRTSIDSDALRNRYADIYDFAPVGYFTLNGQGEITELNLAGAILLGIKRSEKHHHRFSSALISECQVEFNRFLAEVLNARNKKVCEVTLLPTRQGPETIVRIEAVPDENGDECRMVVLDVTAERRAEKLLVEREHYLRTVVDNFPFMVWLKDDQSRFLAVNKVFSEGMGWPTPQSILGKCDLDFVPTNLAAAYLADDSAILASGTSRSQDEMLEIDGKRCWIETYKTPVQIDSQRLGTMGYSRDVSERKAFESALLTSDDLNRSVLNSVPTEIVVVDGVGTILAVNDHWLKFALENGIKPGTAALNTGVGTNYLCICQAAMETFSPGALAANDGIQAVLNGLIPSFRMEYECHSPEIPRWFSMTVTPLIQNAKEGAVITHTDISERKLLESQIREQTLWDALTKLPNRILLKDRLRQAMTISKRSNRYGALFLMELDNHEQVTDSYGQGISDQLLLEVAMRLRRCVREVDTVARFGDVEFAVILSELDEDMERSTCECGRIAEKIRSVLSKRYRFQIAQLGKDGDYVNLDCTVSIGGALLVAQDACQEEMLRCADMAKYQAKLSGGNAIRFHESESLLQE